MQALLLPVYFFGQSGIGVAGEAVVVGRLFCGERVARGNQEERQNQREELVSISHTSGFQPAGTSSWRGHPIERTSAEERRIWGQTTARLL